MQNSKDLLEYFNEITSDSNVQPFERALYLLLKINEERILKLLDEDLTGYWLHKALRQIDVTKNPDMDMAIYHLLHQSNLFWKMLDENTEDDSIQTF